MAQQFHSWRHEKFTQNHHMNVDSIFLTNKKAETNFKSNNWEVNINKIWDSQIMVYCSDTKGWTQKILSRNQKQKRCGHMRFHLYEISQVSKSMGKQGSLCLSGTGARTEQEAANRNVVTYGMRKMHSTAQYCQLYSLWSSSDQW